MLNTTNEESLSQVSAEAVEETKEAELQSEVSVSEEDTAATSEEKSDAIEEKDTLDAFEYALERCAYNI